MSEPVNEENVQKSENNKLELDMSSHLLHKKHKKKYKKRKHSPSYYENLRLTKVYEEREKKWNNRFLNDTIPESIEKVNTRRLGSGRKQGKRLSKYPSIVYGTSQSNKKMINNKSFNIRIVSKVEKKVQIKQKKANKNDQEHELIQLVQKSFQQAKYPLCHKQMLIDLIKNSKSKEVRNMIKLQVSKLKNKTSAATLISEGIERRQKAVNKIKEKKQQISKQMIQQYQQATINLIEEILKWREGWQANYHKITKTNIKLKYKENNKNYFIGFGNDVNFLKKDDEDPDDMFLLRYTKEDLSDSVIIRIRACEMLVLEQNLGSQ